jgi:hypothetical protein
MYAIDAAIFPFCTTPTLNPPPNHLKHGTTKKRCARAIQHSSRGSWPRVLSHYCQCVQNTPRTHDRLSSRLGAVRFESQSAIRRNIHMHRRHARPSNLALGGGNFRRGEIVRPDPPKTGLRAQRGQTRGGNNARRLVRRSRRPANAPRRCQHPLCSLMTPGGDVRGIPILSRPRRFSGRQLVFGRATGNGDPQRPHRRIRHDLVVPVIDWRRQFGLQLSVVPFVMI